MTKSLLYWTVVLLALASYVLGWIGLLINSPILGIIGVASTATLLITWLLLERPERY